MSMLHQHFIRNKPAATLRDFRRHASILSLCDGWPHPLLRGYEAQGPHVVCGWGWLPAGRKTKPTNVFNRTDRQFALWGQRDRRHVTSPQFVVVSCCFPGCGPHAWNIDRTCFRRTHIKSFAVEILVENTLKRTKVLCQFQNHEIWDDTGITKRDYCLVL